MLTRSHFECFINVEAYLLKNTNKRTNYTAYSIFEEIVQCFSLFNSIKLEVNNSLWVVTNELINLANYDENNIPKYKFEIRTEIYTKYKGK